MAITDEWLTIPECVSLLKMNGVEMNEAAMRIAIRRGKIRSEKMFNSRVVHRSEMGRIVEIHRLKRQVTGT